MTPGHARVHARLQHLLRGRARLLPAGPQPRAVDARARLAAQVRDRRRVARERSQGARAPAPRCWSIPAATTRSTGRAGSATGSTSTAARASSGWRSTQDVPIVPVVSIGGQETALFLTPRRAAGAAAGARPDVPPQGAADLARAAVGAERRRHARPHPAAREDHDRDAAADRPARPSSAPDPDLDEIYDHLIRADAGHARRAGRRAPVPGDRMRMPSAHTIVSAPLESVWAVVSDPERVLSFMSGVTRWEVDSEEPTGLGARYRMLMRVGSAEVGGLIEVVEWDPPRELAWTSVTGVDQRGRWRLRARAGRPDPRRDPARLRRRRRRARGVAGRADRRTRGHLPPAGELSPADAAGRARAAARGGGAAPRRARRLILGSQTGASARKRSERSICRSARAR